jgi:hypothetical protein
MYTRLPGNSLRQGVIFRPSPGNFIINIDILTNRLAIEPHHDVRALTRHDFVRVLVPDLVEGWTVAAKTLPQLTNAGKKGSLQCRTLQPSDFRDGRHRSGFLPEHPTTPVLQKTDCTEID